MRHLFSIFFIFGMVTMLSAQNLSFRAGANYGRFYDFRKSEGHFQKDYHPETSFTTSIALSRVKLDSNLYLGFVLNYEQYGGSIYTANGGLGSATSTTGKCKKQVLSLDFYPVELAFWNQLYLGLGINVNATLVKELSGTRYSWGGIDSTYSTTTTDLNSISGLVKTFNAGLVGRVGYRYLFGSWFLEAEYRYYLGLSNEFNSVQASTKSFRHSMVLGIGIKL